METSQFPTDLYDVSISAETMVDKSKDDNEPDDIAGLEQAQLSYSLTSRLSDLPMRSEDGEPEGLNIPEIEPSQPVLDLIMQNASGESQERYVVDYQIISADTNDKGISLSEPALPNSMDGKVIALSSNDEGMQAVQLEGGIMAYIGTADSNILTKVAPLQANIHMKPPTSDRPFHCSFPNCGKTFASGYGLKSHTRVHTGEKPYRCHYDGCIKAFKTSGDLQKHYRTHTGERPFRCPFEGCLRAFTTSNIRKVHIRTHTGERPYQCTHPNCTRSFASATNYKNHIRIHSGEKPYLCTVPGCFRRFTEYSSLYKHNVIHTHNKPYTCEVCGKTYRQTSTLTIHKRSAHGLNLYIPPESDSNSHENSEQGTYTITQISDSKADNVKQGNSTPASRKGARQSGNNLSQPSLAAIMVDGEQQIYVISHVETLHNLPLERRVMKLHSVPGGVLTLSPMNSKPGPTQTLVDTSVDASSIDD